MILYHQDWGRYPNAIVDKQTTNRSFVELAMKLATMGITNHAFFLALHNPELQGVDPFSEDLTSRQKIAIAIECQENPWYALREIIRLPAAGGPNPSRYYADRSLIALFWCYFNHIDYGMVKPRQTGKSVGMDALMVQLLALMGYASKIQLITKDAKLRAVNVRRVHAMIDLLPSYLNPLNRSDANNTETITVNLRGNILLTAVGQASKDRAENLGRGLTAETFLGDEVPYVPNAHISLPVALAAGTAIRRNAAENNAPYGNIWCTTAGPRTTKEGNWAYQIFSSGYMWNEAIYDTDDLEHTLDVMRNNSRAGEDIGTSIFVNATFNHRQLGKTDQWMLESLTNAKQSAEASNRDFFNVWPIGGEGAAIPADVMRRIQAHEEDPSKVEWTDSNYELRWYYPASEIAARMDQDVHVVGLDSSNAVGRDGNGFVVKNSRTGEVAMTCGVNETNLLNYAIWIYDFMMKYRKTVLIPENKSSAQAIIDILLVRLHRAGEDPFKRIYNNICAFPSEHREAYKQVVDTPIGIRSEMFYVKYKGKFGFMTTGAARTFLYDQILSFASERLTSAIKDRPLILQLSGLLLKNGRVDHGSSSSKDDPDDKDSKWRGHDDLVIAWLLTVFMLTQTKHLEWFGLKSYLVLSFITEDTEDMDDSQREEAKAREELRAKIESIKGLIKVEKIPSKAMRMRAEMATLVKRTGLDGGERISLAAVLEEIDEAVKKKKAA